MALGEYATLLMTALLITEIVSLILSAPKTLLTTWDKGEEIKPEGREYGVRALTLGGLTFAAIALLVSAFPGTIVNVIDALILLSLSSARFYV